VDQVDGYAALMNGHADLFAKLYSVLLGREVAFGAPVEKWIVWPMAGETSDPRCCLSGYCTARAPRSVVSAPRWAL
jgi:hypothetical protein